MFKFIGFLTVVTVAHAGFVPAAVPLAVDQSVLTKSVEEYDPHPQYNFAYDVQDSISGDSKAQVESRDGDVVHGQYSLIDADGFRRTVDYTADSVNGFNAVVNRVPLGIAAHSVKSVADPTVIKTAQIPTPINYAAAHVDPTVVNVAQYASPKSQIGAQTILQSAFTPAAFTSPTLLRSAPIATYSAASPALVQTAYAPAALASPTLLRSNLAAAYVPAPAPQLIKTTAAFAAPTLLKSASVAPGLHLSGSPAIVKTSYASPYASYAY